MSLLDAVNLATGSNNAPEKKKKTSTKSDKSSTSSLLQSVKAARGEDTALSPTPTAKNPLTKDKTADKEEGGNIFQKVFSAIGGLGNAVGGLFKPKTVIEPIKLQSGIKLNLVDPPAPGELDLAGKKTGNLPTLDKKIKVQDPGITQKDIDAQKAAQDKLISPFKSSGGINGGGSVYVDLAPGTMNLLAELQVDPLSLKKTPKMTLTDALKPFWDQPIQKQAVNTYIQTIKDGVMADADSIQRIFTGKTKAEKGGAVLETGARTVGVVLSPITALFSAANEIPVLGTVSRLISLPFAVLGDAGADLAYPLANMLPIEKEEKEKIVGGIGEVVGLALMIGVGGKINEIPGKVKENLVKRFGETDATTIIKEAETLANKPKESPFTGTKSPEEVADNVFRTGMDKTPDGQTLLNAAEEARVSGKYLLLEEPQVAGLLNAENPKAGGAISGEGFTMTDKANKSKVEVGKVINDYHEAVDAYNKNPTTTSLGRVQKARERLGNLEKEELVKMERPEAPNAPKTVGGVEIRPVGEDIKVYRGTQKGESGIDTERPNGITGGASTSTDKAIAQAFADKKGGVVEEYQIPKTAKIVNHSELERLVKYVPMEEKAVAVKKFIADNQVDVVKFDVPEGVKGEAEYRVVNAKIFDKISEKEVKVSRDQMPVGKGEERVSKLEARMKGVIGKASEEQIDNLGLSTYNKMNRKENIADAAKYAVEHPEDAIKVLSGELDAPKGIHPESIYVALTEMAREDLTLATKLTSLQATALGQRLGLLAELDPLNPVNIVNDIYKFKAAEFEKTHAGRKLNEVKKNYMEKGKAKIKAPTDWSSFIEEVRC